MTFIIIIFVVEIVLSIRKASLGFAFYIFFRLSFPPMVRFLGLSCNSLFLAIFLIILLLFHFRLIRYISPLAKKYLIYATALFIGIFSLSFFSQFVPIEYQHKHIIQFFYTEIIPFLLIPIVLRNSKDNNAFIRIVALGALFNVLYGLFTFLSNSNPLVEMYGAYTEDFDSDFALSIEGRYGLSSRAVGIYSDKIFLSLVSLLIFTFFYNKKQLNKYFRVSLLVVSFLTCFLTTQRTALLCICIFLVMVTNKKVLVTLIRKYALIISCLFIIIIVSPPFQIVRESVYSTIYIFDDAKQEKIGNKGSSLSMRLGQLDSVIEIAGPYILQGFGYGFSSYRIGTSLNSAEFYGLESFVLQIIANSGMIGMLFWILFLYKMIRLSFLRNDDNKKYNVAYSLSYLIAILMTDTSGSFFLFLLFLSVNTNKVLLNSFPSYLEKKWGKSRFNEHYNVEKVFNQTN